MRLLSNSQNQYTENSQRGVHRVQVPAVRERNLMSVAALRLVDACNLECFDFAAGVLHMREQVCSMALLLDRSLSSNGGLDGKAEQLNHPVYLSIENLPRSLQRLLEEVRIPLKGSVLSLAAFVSARIDGVVFTRELKTAEGVPRSSAGGLLTAERSRKIVVLNFACYGKNAELLPGIQPDSILAASLLREAFAMQLSQEFATGEKKREDFPPPLQERLLLEKERQALQAISQILVGQESMHQRSIEHAERRIQAIALEQSQIELS